MLFVFVFWLTQVWALEPPEVLSSCASFYAEVVPHNYNKEERILQRHAVFGGIRDRDNRTFVGLARYANSGMPTPAKLFFDLENAVLKELNDKVVQDKDFVTALTNLHKDVVWQTISADPVLRKHIVAKYSDFKSVRLAFDVDNPEIRRKLKEKMTEINGRYRDYVASLGLKAGWQEKARGLAADARNWYHGGVGASPDEAGLATRSSRYFSGVSEVRSFLESKELLEESRRVVTKYQQWTETRFASVPGFLTLAPGGKKVLSAEAIESIRKVSPKENTNLGYQEAIQKVLRERFQISVSGEEALALREMLNQADRFSPGLLLEERVVIDLGQPAAEVLSADFKGQNARNLEETLKALVEPNKSLEETVRLARAGEEAATRSLEERKGRFQRVLGEMFPGLKASFSGDDGMAFLPKPLTEVERKKFAELWQREGGRAEDIRLTFERFQYADTGKSIPTEMRSKLVVAAEGMEKKLRADLIASVPRERLNDLQIAVALTGNETKKASAKIYLRPKDGEVSPDLLKKVEEIVRSTGLGFDGIVLAK
jgi:hypothetical protein